MPCTIDLTDQPSHKPHHLTLEKASIASLALESKLETELAQFGPTGKKCRGEEVGNQNSVTVGLWFSAENGPTTEEEIEVSAEASARAAADLQEDQRVDFLNAAESDSDSAAIDEDDEEERPGLIKTLVASGAPL